MTKSVVSTSAGSIAGTREQGLHVFRGVPYAAPPVGELRFASPRQPARWSGVREASRFSPPFVQSNAPASAEDALCANVWTPDPAGTRPVFLYVHGGGWQVGAGSVPTFDGARLAAAGDIVVINFNYRLGVFGWGLHDELADPDTGHCANWGLQDQRAALEWVRENARAFGGDPDNLTLCGTSAGGATAWHLALLPELRGKIRRLVAISAAHPRQPAFALTREDAATVYETIATRLGTDVKGLREVPAGALHEEWLRTFAGPPGDRLVGSGREYRGPVLDGRTVTAYAHELPTPDIPLMTVYNTTEGSFFTDPLSPSFPPAPPAPADEAELRGAVRGVLEKLTPHVPDQRVTACLAAYREAARAEGLADDPRSLWTEIWGDGLFRHPITELAERHARTGRTPQYVMEFTHPTRPPHFGTPHDATSKFLFGSHGTPENVKQFGDGPLERRVSRIFAELVASFVRDGAPGGTSVPEWPVFSPDRPSTLVLGGERVAHIATTPKRRQLRFWDEAGSLL
ncbi:carboxylesterase family protein [Streptomyces litchfieldiae]|uniref:Carboxylic ester hydrolase n=1 Tax=Streptomyces litchfieldiae TaxID=3075543 RepID=A0ABU2MW44_9ACTN|nr:carboxylesterase family protein [Streptomyces sp. DSM 44938]MDT0345810.1 carboxylesterase family protein [Streptomyces sp. DSM 44938]